MLAMYDKKSNVTNSNYGFTLWGLLIHLILLWGVLDINFHSPIIQNLPNVPVLKDPPAKRLVLFVADGLRFRTFIETPPKFLKHVMTSGGIWGISHTRMPTESRPGIVAICAGLYEDPSAIFKGWKENPVDFDSIFNQSQFSWAWGSPDIIPIFTKGITNGIKVLYTDHKNARGSYVQLGIVNRATFPYTDFCYWLEVTTLVTNENPSKRRWPSSRYPIGCAKGNVYGETYPHEWQNFDIMQGQIWRLDSWVFDKYLNWLREEAHKAKDLEGIIFFLHLLGCDTTGHAAKPSSREYTDNMNYVDRKIEEVVQMTENFFGDNATAYIFTADHGMTDWGSHGSGSADETETPIIVWGAQINASNYQDVEQVDITPLISSLIGIPVPINNEGVLPWEYLKNADPRYVNRALLNNLKQLTHQVKANREMNCEDSSFTDWRERELDNKIFELDKYIEMKDSPEILKETVDAISLAKKSLSYFRQYQRSRFLVYLSIMWIGWIILLFFKIPGTRRPVVSRSILLVADVTFACILIIIFTTHRGCKYWRLPYYASLAVISLWLAVRSIFTYSIKLKIQNNKHFWIAVTGTISLLIIMFMGLMHRSILSIGMLCTAFIRKFISNDTRNFLWTALFLAVFPLLPIVEPHPRVYVVLLSICVAGVMTALKIESKYRKTVEIFRLLLTGLVYVEFIDGRKWISWAILLTTPLYICTYSTELKERMKGVMLGLFCPLVLLSSSYEPFFFIILALHLSSLPQHDNASSVRGYQSSEYFLTIEELLKAATFMLYTLLCFFGTGNMASISSFDPSWTRHFVTVFSPFTMFSLILLKISIPLMLIGCASHLLKSQNIFLAVLLLGDCLSLPLIYYVTPEGSWLDIGSAISRFTIAISLPCLLLLLYYFSYPLMTFIPNKLKFHVDSEKKHIV